MSDFDNPYSRQIRGSGEPVDIQKLADETAQKLREEHEAAQEEKKEEEDDSSSS